MKNNIVLFLVPALFVLLLGCDGQEPSAPDADSEKPDAPAYLKMKSDFGAVKKESLKKIRLLERQMLEQDQLMRDATREGEKAKARVCLERLAGFSREMVVLIRDMGDKMEKTLEVFDDFSKEIRDRYVLQYIGMYFEILELGRQDNQQDEPPSFLHFSLRRADRMCELIRQAAKDDSDLDIRPMINRFFQYKYYEGNRKLLSIYLQKNPDNPGATHMLAATLLPLERYDEAIETLKKTAALSAWNKSKADERISHYEETKRFAGAESEFISEDAEKADGHKNPLVKFETDAGNIIIELFEDDAKNTTANFISLVESGFYDGTIFHRSEGWVLQGGDPLGCGLGGPGYTIKTENNRRRHFKGYLGMARAARDGESSQFYFVRNFTPQLDESQFTIFGRITKGMDVMMGIKQGDKIKKAVLLRKRDHEYKPETKPDK